MKRILLTVVALAALGAHAAPKSNANTSSISSVSEQGSSEIMIVPVLGVAAMAITSDVGSSDLDTGLSLGTFVDFGRSSIVFETGAIFNQFGGKKGSVSLNLSYLSVPTLAKFNFSGDAEKTMFAKIGLMPGILVSKSARVRGESTDDVSGVKTFDLPVYIGIGGAIPVSENNSMTIELAYLRSLTSIVDGSVSVRNQGVTLLTGVTF